MSNHDKIKKEEISEMIGSNYALDFPEYYPETDSIEILETELGNLKNAVTDLIHLLNKKARSCASWLSQ